MSQPAPYNRSTSFTNFQAANPTSALPGASVDLELNAVKQTLDQVLSNLAVIQNDDTTVKNASVGLNQLSPSVLLGFNVPTTWATGRSYTASPASTVFNTNSLYVCLVSHTSGTFATDLSAGKWQLILNLAAIPITAATQVSVVASGLLTTDAQTSLQALDTGKAATSHTHVSSAISDSTTAGRALLTAASSAAQTALLGLAPQFTTGDVKPTFKTVADAGWVMMNDGTIGSATSGATFANNTSQALYTLLWNNIIDTWAPVTTGRGATAAADWAANKPIALTKALGRAFAIGGAGSGLTTRALGQTLGEEAHVQILAEMVSHTHGVTDPGHTHPLLPLGSDSASSGTIQRSSNNSNTLNPGSSVTGISINSAGSGAAANVMQPTTFLNAMICL